MDEKLYQCGCGQVFESESGCPECYCGETTEPNAELLEQYQRLHRLLLRL